jgi:hypothetical protein
MAASVGAMAAGKQAVLATLARDLNNLRDPDRFKRKAGLDALSRELFGPRAPPADVRASLLLEDASRAVVELLADPAEVVREGALGLCQRLLDVDGDAVAARLLLLLLPALAARVGRAPAAEESEELRLLWARLLGDLLGRNSVAAGPLRGGGAAFDDVCAALAALCGDAFHSVKVEAAGGVARLCAAAPARVGAALSALAAACVGALAHQRGPVRVAALGALAALLPLGGESLPTVLRDTVLPALKVHLRYDRTASVRRALAAALGGWLRGGLPPHVLASRAVGEPQLLLLLAGLAADESREVAEAALAALAAAAEGGGGGSGGGGGGGGAPAAGDAPVAGDLAAAAAAAAPDEGMAGYAAAAALSERTAGALRGEGGAADAAAPAAPACDSGADTPAALLPPPFSAAAGPPPAPLRALVARLLPATLPLVLEELRDWTAKCRVFAAGALRTLLAAGGGAALGQLEPLLGALCAGSRDDDEGVRALLGEAGRIVGAVVPPAAQLGVLLPQLRGEVASLAGSSPEGAASALAVLAAALSAMRPDALRPLLPRLADTLALPSLAAPEPPALRVQLALALRYAVAAALPPGAPPPPPGALPHAALDALLVASLHVRSGEGGSKEVRAAGAAAMAAMAAALGEAGGAEALFGAAMPRLLPRLAAGAGAWTRDAVPRRAFDTLLRVARPALAGADGSGAAALVGAALDAFAASLAPSREPEVRLAQLVLLEAFVSGGGGGGGPRQAAVDAALGEHGGRLLRECVLPNLVWRVGLAASTVRKCAVAVVVAVVTARGGGGGGGAPPLLPPWAAAAALGELLPALKGCLGDDDATTRHLACRAVGGAVRAAGARSLDGEALRGLFAELLKRLDDSNDAVRVGACGALRELPAAAAPSDVRGMPAEYTTDTLLVHLDDADGGVQAAVYEALLPWAALEPAYALKKAAEARDRLRHPAYVEKLVAYLSQLA